MGFIDSMAAQVGSNLVGAGAGSVGEAVGRGVNKLFGIDYKKEQLEQQFKLMQQQMYGNKEMMDYSNSLQKDMFDYTSPKKRMEQLEEAGLSSGLMYGMGGGGGSTISNPSGSVGMGIASNEMDRKAQRNNDLQGAMMQANIDVMKSQAKKNNADADYTAGTQTNIGNQGIEESKTRIDNIIANTSNTEAKKDLTELQSDYQKILNSFEGDIKELNVQMLTKQIRYLNNDTERLIMNNEILEEQKPELIKQLILQNANIISQTLKNDKQRTEIDAQIRSLNSASNLNDIKSIGEGLMNRINSVEVFNTEGSGMTKETGALAPLINGVRAGMSGAQKLIQDISNKLKK